MYFDAYEQIQHLPDEQLGMLFRAIVECARKEAEGEDGITGVERRYPRMTEGTQMAFRFLSATIRRDAQTYEEKCENYRHAARRKAEKRTETEEAAGKRLPEAPAPEKLWPPSTEPAAKPPELSRQASRQAREVTEGGQAAWAYARMLNRTMAEQ